jgi:hypothetical protein
MSYFHPTQGKQWQLIGYQLRGGYTHYTTDPSSPRLFTADLESLHNGSITRPRQRVELLMVITVDDRLQAWPLANLCKYWLIVQQIMADLRRDKRSLVFTHQWYPASLGEMDYTGSFKKKKKNVPVRLLGTWFTNAISYFEIGPQHPYMDILTSGESW